MLDSVQLFIGGFLTTAVPAWACIWFWPVDVVALHTFVKGCIIYIMDTMMMLVDLFDPPLDRYMVHRFLCPLPLKTNSIDTTPSAVHLDRPNKVE